MPLWPLAMSACMTLPAKPLQDTMTAIRLGKPLAECGYALQPNAEQYLRARSQLGQLYPPELLQETTSIAARCTFSLDELRYQYPDELTGRQTRRMRAICGAWSKRA